MYNVLIWGTGKEYNNFFNCIKFLEYKGEISIIGITSNDKDIATSIDGYQFIKKDKILSLDFDYCLVAIADFTGILNEAEMLGINKSKLIPLHVLSIPNFNFNDYIKLKNSSLTILSPNCWAGICYHRLGLEFLSPTINMWEDRDDFNKLVMNLDFYLSHNVEFWETRYSSWSKKNYPVGILGDIELHFNHYENFENAVSCWERRKKRINKNNILIISFSDSKKTLYDFEDLPYKNKLIFTSTSIDTPSSFSIHLEESLDESLNETRRLGLAANKTASGTNNLINIISLLNHEEDFTRSH